MSRPQSLAVHDSNAELAVFGAVVDEICESRLGFRNGHAVQIDLCLDAEASARQFAHRSPADGWPVEAQVIGIAFLNCIDIGGKALAQGIRLIGARKSRFRRGLPRWRCRTLFGLQWPGSRYRASKQFGLVIGLVIGHGIASVWGMAQEEHSV